MPTTYGNDIVYCLKSHCGVRGYCRQKWVLQVQIICKFSNERTCKRNKNLQGLSCGFEGILTFIYIIMTKNRSYKIVCNTKFLLSLLQSKKNKLERQVKAKYAGDIDIQHWNRDIIMPFYHSILPFCHFVFMGISFEIMGYRISKKVRIIGRLMMNN